jgi:hypothetical protein
MPKYLVEAISQYRMVYCIEANTLEEAVDYKMTDDPEELGQRWLGETTISSRVVSDSEIIDLFDDLNEYLKHIFPVERKMGFVAKANKDREVEE